MAVIQIGRGYEVVLDDEDYDALKHRKWRAVVQGSEPNLRVYAQVQIDGKFVRMHRVIWQRANGPIPAGAEIDHRDPGQFGGLDNRRSNLRLTTKSLNQANSRMRRNNTSGFKGVWWQKQARMWRADVLVNRKKVHVGYFLDKEEAARAYDRAALAAFGTHARLNFPVKVA